MEGRGLSGCGDSTGGPKDISPQILGPPFTHLPPTPVPILAPQKERPREGRPLGSGPWASMGNPGSPLNLSPPSFSQEPLLSLEDPRVLGGTCCAGLDHMT